MRMNEKKSLQKTNKIQAAHQTYVKTLLGVYMCVSPHHRLITGSYIDAFSSDVKKYVQLSDRKQSKKIKAEFDAIASKCDAMSTASEEFVAFQKHYSEKLNQDLDATRLKLKELKLLRENVVTMYDSMTRKLEDKFVEIAKSAEVELSKAHTSMTKVQADTTYQAKFIPQVNRLSLGGGTR